MSLYSTQDENLSLKGPPEEETRRLFMSIPRIHLFVGRGWGADRDSVGSSLQNLELVRRVAWYNWRASTGQISALTLTCPGSLGISRF